MRVLDWIMATVIVVGFSMAGMGDEAYGAEPVDSMSRPWAPPCIYEDGSSQRKCAWVGTVRVNGEGKSFVMHRVDGRRVYTYMSPRKAQAYVNEWKRRFCGPTTSANPHDRICTHWQRR